MRTFFLASLLFFSSVSLAQQTITVGVVPQFPVKKLHSIWKPVLSQLEKETGLIFELKGSPDIPSFEKEFMTGEFDLAYMNPYHYIVASDLYTPMVRDIGRQLYGIIVVAKDSPIKTVADLDGEKIALPAPNALGASLMTRAAMTNEFHISYEPLYVKTHSSVYLNVALGKTAAGGGVQKTLSQQPDKIKNRLRVLYQTQKVAPHPLVANKSLPESTVQLIQQAMLRIAQTKEGQALLSKVPFKMLGVAGAQDYSPLRALNLDPFFQSHH